VVESRIAYTDAEEAVACAEAWFPVVVKLISKTITHKSDVGGVRLTLQSPPL
jgi:acetyltransferase